MSIYGVSSHGQQKRDRHPGWGLGEGLQTPHRKMPARYEILQTGSELDGFF
jgi:hypothetical protein